MRTASLEKLEAEVEQLLLEFNLDAASDGYLDEARKAARAIVDAVLISLAAELLKR